MKISQDTYKEIGMDWLIKQINVTGYYGIKHKRQLKPFSPDDLTSLIIEYDMVDEFLRYLSNLDENEKLNVKRCFKNLKNIDGYISIIKNQGVLGVSDIFALKEFIRNLIDLDGFVKKYSQKVNDFYLEDFNELWQLLNPPESDPHTFMLYDDYSEALGKIRKKLKLKLEEYEFESDKIKTYIKEKFAIDMFSKREIRVKRKEEDLLKKMIESDLFKLDHENYMYYSYGLKENSKQYSLKLEIENLKIELEREEDIVREILTDEIRKFLHSLEKVIVKIGYLDYSFGKAEFIIENNCVRPSISSSNNIRIDGGINLMLKDILLKSGKAVRPISIDVRQGVNLITGANMGGKTVALRTIAIMTTMAQMGIYVPAKNFEYYPIDFLFASIGDNQSQELGLSSFGSEMDMVSEAISMSYKNGLILLDELASGTNPKEGYAITKAIMEHFKNKNCKLLVTSHYDGLEGDSYVNHYQVKGLRDVDFKMLKENVQLHELMDYSLVKGNSQSKQSMDAINVAEFMGIEKEIIDKAKKILWK